MWLFVLICLLDRFSDDARRAVYRSRLFGLERRMVTDILLSVDVVSAFHR